MEQPAQISSKLLQEAKQSCLTICDCLRFAVSQFEKAELFYGHGTDNAWDEARYLIFDSLHLPLDCPDVVLQARLTASEQEEVLAQIARRVNERIPVAYLRKKAYFAGLPFYVDERVIIPRSPIAELINHHFEGVIAAPMTHALDLCTGSGCIAIALALAYPELKVDAVDINADALAVAQRNITDYKLEQQVELIQSDLFSNIPGERQYDLIISNPPYVPQASFDALPGEYRAEPALALVAGEDGLSCVTEIIHHAAKYLRQSGILILELGEARAAFEALYPTFPATWLEFEHGGEGILAVTCRDLKQWG